MKVEVWQVLIALIGLILRVVDFIIDKTEKLPSDEKPDKEPKQ